MSNVKPRLALAAFAGALLWIGGGLVPAMASETVTAITSPAARIAELGACRVISPTFQHKGRERLHAQEVRFPGGAKLRFPVAAPCPARPAHADDV